MDPMNEDGHLDWGTASQHTDLLEDLDALVDPETQRIIDEADLLEYTEDDEDDGDNDEDDDDDNESGDDDDGTEDDIEDEDSPSQEGEDNRSASASQQAPAADAAQLPQTALSKSLQQYLHPPAGLLFGLGPLGPPQDVSLPQNLDDDEPICLRTRTRMPMNHVSLDELDALLGNEDEGLFDEEGEQYEQFLRVLRGEEDLRELLDDDDDEDEDFTLDWDELMGPNPFGQDEGGEPPPLRRSQRRCNYVYQNKNERPGHRERELESTIRIQAKQLKPLLPGGDSAAGGSQSPAGQRGWGAPHTLRLRALLAQHAQLLTTTFTMAILTPGSSQAAGIAGQMLHALQSMPQWLWSPVLQGATFAVSKASSLHEAAANISQLPPCFTSALLPNAWSAQMSEGWLSGEDLLLARAMRRFGKQQLKIQQYFLPTRTVTDISARIKHLTRISAPPNPVKDANQRNVAQLQPHEISIIDEQLSFLGKQPKRWEIIVNQHLPYRTVSHVSKLWAAHQASLQESGPGSLHWALVGEAGPSCVQHGQAFLQRPGAPGGMPAPAGQLQPFPSSAQCVQGPQHGAAAGGPLYDQAAPSQLQLAQHSTGVAELHPAPPAHVHSVMLSSQADPAAQQPAPALYQNSASLIAPAMAGANNATFGAMPFSQAHAQPSALPASQRPPAPHAHLQVAGARIGQHHAQQRQDSSSSAQLLQQYSEAALVAHQQSDLVCSGNGVNSFQAGSSTVAAEHDAAAPQRPDVKHEHAPSDRLLHDNQRAQDLPRSLPASQRNVMPRTRPRKRKQPAPSHGSVCESLPEPSLDDVLLSAVNERVRQGTAGRRSVRSGGRGRGSAATAAQSGLRGPPGPIQAQMAASTQLAAGMAPATLLPAGSPSRPPQQGSLPAPHAPQSPPFWHLSPSSPPPPASPAALVPPLNSQPAAAAGASAAAASKFWAANPVAGILHDALGTTSPQHGLSASALPAQQPCVDKPWKARNIHENGYNRPMAFTAANAASDRPPNVEPGQSQAVCQTEAEQQQHGTAAIDVQRAAAARPAHPRCRKSLEFVAPAQVGSAQPEHRQPEAGELAGGSISSGAPQRAEPARSEQQHPVPGAIWGAERAGGTPQQGAQAMQGSDAELVIGGVPTRWTKAEDTAILHAALKTNGTLTAESCARIMKLPRDQNSWPLPRSAKHIRARLDWLLTRLLSGSKKA